jgi:hypothetical protein
MFLMQEELSKLIEAARNAAPMDAKEKEAQRRSFAYGNTAFENPMITREMIDREAEKLATGVANGELGKR